MPTATQPSTEFIKHASDPEIHPEEQAQPIDQPSDGRCDPARIGLLAYTYWEERGRPDGSAEEDWYRAEQSLQQERGYQNPSDL